VRLGLDSSQGGGDVLSPERGVGNMELRVDSEGTRLVLANRGEVDVWDAGSIWLDGLDRELADGEIFRLADGGVVIRSGNEEIWYCPPPPPAAP
jgi:hypothetical protein